jgi:hypothetical protein
MYVHIITAIGKTAVSKPWSSLEGSVRLHSVSTSLDFATNISFCTEKGVQPFVQPPTCRNRSPIDTVTQLCPKHRALRHLLRLVGQRWGHYNLPPHQIYTVYRYITMCVYIYIYIYILGERERVGVVMRGTTIVGGGIGNNFRFESSQALPASPSNKSEAWI